MFFDRWGEKKIPSPGDGGLADLGRRWGGIRPPAALCNPAGEPASAAAERKSHLAAAGHLQAGGSWQALAAASDLSELYRQRCALYEHFSDEAILNNGTPEDALRRLKECMV